MERSLQASGLWRRGGVGHSLAHIYALSFCAQSVQLGAVPALIALRLNASGYSEAVVGVVAAAPWMAVLLIAGRVPGLLARHQPARVNAVALALSGLAVLTLLLVTDPIAVFLANACLGVGLILRWIACDSWVIGLAPEAIRGRVIGAHETLLGLSMAAGPGIIALCGSTTGRPFLACLGLLVVAAAALVRIDRTGPVMQASADSHVPSLPYVSLMACAAFMAGFIETSSMSLLPVLSLHAHWPVGSILALGAFTVGGTLAQFPVGHMADRIGHRASQLWAAAVISGAGILVIVVAHHALLLGLALLVLGGAAGGMITLAVIESATVAPAAVGTATSRVALAYTVGSILGPAALGALAQVAGPASFPVTFAVLAALFCGAAALVGRTRTSATMTA